MHDVLREIVAATRAALGQRASDLESLRRAAIAARAGRERNRLAAALRSGKAPRVIAEIKAASPSAGPIASDPDVDSIARAYRRGGASAISVVTEPRFFRGSSEWVTRAAAASGLPVLMKDFVIDPVQIYDAALAGADALLLIAAILDRRDLENFTILAEQVGIDSVVEVHDEAELEEAIRAGARIVGVNNRNLRDFSLDLGTAERLSERIPPTAIRIAESGIRSSADAERLQRAGFDNFLVGEWLLRQNDPAEAVRRLRGEQSPRVKICGITRPEDALAAVEAGAEFIGLVFAAESPRRVHPARAREIRNALPAGVATVGVFRNQPVEEIRRIADAVPLDLVQLHGDEGPEEIEQMPLPVIKAVAVNLSAPDTSRYARADWLLFDASSPGGGRQFDWALLQNVTREKPFFLAGGLHPGNVSAAVAAVRPDGIDVSSGVEDSPGIKSTDKIRALFAALKRS